MPRIHHRSPQIARRRRLDPRAVLAGLAVILLPPAPAVRAQTAGEGAPPPAASAVQQSRAGREGGGFRYRNELTLGGSYGNAVRINGSAPIDIGSVLLRWTHGSRHHRLFGGQPAWGFEVIPYLRFDQDPDAWGAGWHMLVEDRFRPEAAVRPTVRLGAGMTYQNRRVPPGETRYNFSLFVGVGVAVDTGPHTAFAFEYRMHHVSNADTGVRNPGINANTVAVGFTWRY